MPPFVFGCVTDASATEIAQDYENCRYFRHFYHARADESFEGPGVARPAMELLRPILSQLHAVFGWHLDLRRDVRRRET